MDQNNKIECNICNKFVLKTSYTRHCLSITHKK